MWCNVYVIACAGTRLVYDRAFLLECRNSPLANSPPVGLPQIPGVTCTAPPSQMPKNGVNPGKHHGHVGHHHGHVPLSLSTASAPHHAPVQPKKPQPSAGTFYHVLGSQIPALISWSVPIKFRLLMNSRRLVLTVNSCIVFTFCQTGSQVLLSRQDRQPLICH